MNKSLLTKTCSSCGMQKTLSAFLQLTGPAGTTYGNICSSCRKTQLDKAKAPKQTDESTTGETGIKIDSKRNVKERTDKKTFLDTVEQQYYLDRKKGAEKKSSQIKTLEKAADTDKRVRESIESSSFFDSAKTKPADTKVFGGEDQMAEARHLETYGPTQATYISGTERNKSSIVRQFLYFIGANAPLTQAILGTKKPSAPESVQKKKEASATPEATPQKEETLRENAEKKWRPGS